MKILFSLFLQTKNLCIEEEYLHHVKLVATKTGNNVNSMLVDKQLKRKTEILEILGPINKELNNRELDASVNVLAC